MGPRRRPTAAAVLICLAAASVSAPVVVRAQTAGPAQTDLRPSFEKWQLPLRKQGARNTCSVMTMVGALEFALSRKLNRGTPLSPEYLNAACNQVIRNTTADRGQFFSDLWKGYEQYGICMEKEMPYAPKFDPAYRPTADALRSAQAVRAQGLQLTWIKPGDGKVGVTQQHLEQVRTVLRSGWPVGAGSFHSVLFVGFRDDPTQPGGGTFLTRDSGSGAEGTMTYAEALNRLCDIFWIGSQ